MYKCDMGMLYDPSLPVLVTIFLPASIDDVNSAISQDNCETTVTYHSAYSLGMIIITNNQLQ